MHPFFSKDEVRKNREAEEYFRLQVLGPDFVSAVVVALGVQLHPLKVLLGWEEQGGKAHRDDGMADKGGLKGRDAGRCHTCSRERKEEKVAGKKKNSRGGI